MKEKIKSGLIHTSQIVYLTARAFFQNGLGACASDCTLNFIFSAIPLVMLTLTIFIGILHASPSILEGFSTLSDQIAPFFNISDYINGLSGGFVVNWVNFVLACFMIWMARKVFLSVIQSLSKIFNTVAPSRPVIKQLLTFGGEVLIVVVVAVVFFAAFLTRQIFKLPVFQKISSLSPFLFSHFSNFLVNLVLYIVIFIMTLVAYKFGSGTKPKTKLCFFSALLCTVSFYVTVTVISVFMNKANYNTIYGVLSNVIILLFEVCIFFNLFLIFAQVIYTIQFFNSNLLAELYLLPKPQAKSIDDIIRRAIFITPSALMTKENMEIFKIGEEIYKEGDKTECVYYLVSGNVKEERDETIKFRSEGSFFGDLDFTLDTFHHSTATALTECKIIKISKEDFNELLDKNPKAAIKAMSKLSRYAAKFYGRDETILL